MIIMKPTTKKRREGGDQSTLDGFFTAPKRAKATLEQAGSTSSILEFRVAEQRGSDFTLWTKQEVAHFLTENGLSGSVAQTILGIV